MNSIRLYSCAAATAAAVMIGAGAFVPAAAQSGVLGYYRFPAMQPEPFFDKQTKIFHVSLKPGKRSPFQPDDELSGPTPAATDKPAEKPGETPGEKPGEKPAPEKPAAPPSPAPAAQGVKPAPPRATSSSCPSRWDATTTCGTTSGSTRGASRLKRPRTTASGYVHLRAMGGGNMTEWQREFYPVFDREGPIVDVRHNSRASVSGQILQTRRRRGVESGRPPGVTRP